MSINRVNISGNLTRDPELRATAGGTQVLSFGVAVNDRRKNPQTGDWEDYPNFVDCTMFGTRAEAVSRYLSKGTKVAIEGKLRYSSWDKDGQRRSKLEVVVDEVEFMSSRQRAEQGNPPYVAERPQAAPQAYAPQPAPQWSAQQAYRNPPATTSQRPQAPAPQAPQAYAPQPVQPELYDEDIPF
ncbi:single-stranded DNA-binding protein [Parolsenella catena]|uniref:single-stranded DNA-binding protein n=1 Tax=Parolsenella catena TaxID=2003188 RepID=UPI003AF1963C